MHTYNFSTLFVSPLRNLFQRFLKGVIYRIENKNSTFIKKYGLMLTQGKHISSDKALETI
jgi:hypothetical protein